MNEQEKNELIKAVEQSGLEKSQSQTILDQFSTFFAQAKEWENKANVIVVTNERQVKAMGLAREARLELKKIRVEAEHTRKRLKEKALLEGKAIDGIANVIKALIVPIEEHLEKQEKFAEVQAALKAEETFNKRVEALRPYVYDVAMYNLREMGSAAFDHLLTSSKLAVEAQKKADRKAEDERLAKEKAEREEQEKMRAENKKLQQEAEAREVDLEKKREIEAKKQAAREEAMAKERAVAAAKQRVEHEARIKAEAALEEKQKAEAKVKTDAIEADRQARLAPEKEKLNSYANAVLAVKIPQELSKAGIGVVEKAQAKLLEVSQFIKEATKAL